jgi:hypothetical protein
MYLVQIDEETVWSVWPTTKDREGEHLLQDDGDDEVVGVAASKKECQDGGGTGPQQPQRLLLRNLAFREDTLRNVEEVLRGNQQSYCVLLDETDGGAFHYYYCCCCYRRSDDWEER